MPIDINAIFNETRGRNFELFEEHVNPVFVKVLRTLGFNRSWVRGEGAYLWDETGTRYLDFLTNVTLLFGLKYALPDCSSHINPHARNMRGNCRV